MSLRKVRKDMTWWLGQHIGHSAHVIAPVLAAAAALALWLARCRHPNPHYLRAVTQPDAATGRKIVIQPARYICYECGRSWEARQRDPAWAPTHLVHKFSGYDEDRARRAVTRAAIEQEQRRFLAANRIERPEAASKAARSHGQRNRPVIDINSRKPA